MSWEHLEPCTTHEHNRAVIYTCGFLETQQKFHGNIFFQLFHQQGQSPVHSHILYGEEKTDKRGLGPQKGSGVVEVNERV